MSVLRTIGNKLAGRRKTTEINLSLDAALGVARSARGPWDISFSKGWRNYFGANIPSEEAARFLSKQFEDSEKYPVDATYQVFTGQTDTRVYLDVRERVVRERLGELTVYDTAFPETEATLTYALKNQNPGNTGRCRDKLADTLQHLRLH